MDIKISSVWELAAETMEGASYMKSSIRRCRKYFKYLEQASEDGVCDDEDAAEEWVAARKLGGRSYCDNVVDAKKRVADIIATYWATGRIDLSMRSWAPPQPVPESPAPLDALAGFDRDNRARRLAEQTCDHYWQPAREYTVYLEKQRITCTEDADAANVMGFLSDAISRWKGNDGCHIATNFRPFLKFLGRRDLMGALKMANPSAEHRIVPMLDGVDEKVVVPACCNRLVPAGDAAITLLALTTGMRACDIVNLKLENIDWHASAATMM